MAYSAIMRLRTQLKTQISNCLTNPFGKPNGARNRESEKEMERISLSIIKRFVPVDHNRRPQRPWSFRFIIITFSPFLPPFRDKLCQQSNAVERACVRWWTMDALLCSNSNNIYYILRSDVWLPGCVALSLIHDITQLLRNCCTHTHKFLVRTRAARSTRLPVYAVQHRQLIYRWKIAQATFVGNTLNRFTW